MSQLCFRTFVMVLASVLAHAAAPVVAQDTDDARRLALTRPTSDFLEKQGQHLTMGIVPECLSFTAYFNPVDGTNRAASIDYAGLGAAVIKQQTRSKVVWRTQMDGIVYERPLPEGVLLLRPVPEPCDPVGVRIMGTGRDEPQLTVQLGQHLAHQLRSRWRMSPPVVHDHERHLTPGFTPSTI